MDYLCYNKSINKPGQEHIYMDDMFSDLVNRIQADLKKTKKTPKMYKPMQKSIDRIGFGEKIVDLMATVCTTSLANDNIHAVFDEFIAIRPYQKIITMDMKSKCQIEQKIADLVSEARANDTFYPQFFKTGSFPSYRRLEFLYDDANVVLVTDDQSVAIFDSYQIYFQYLVKLYLELPISESMIERTFQAILSLCKPSYSHWYHTHRSLSSAFMLRLSLKNEKLHQKLLQVAIAWYQTHHRIKVEDFPIIMIVDFTYLLSDEELIALKSKYFTLLEERYNEYANGKIGESPQAILSNIKRVRSWTNHYYQTEEEQL
jgi:hypothetical protein